MTHFHLLDDERTLQPDRDEVVRIRARDQCSFQEARQKEARARRTDAYDVLLSELEAPSAGPDRASQVLHDLLILLREELS